MADRGAAPVEEIQRFAMQLVWCMFAEDLKLMDGLPLSHAVETILRDPQLNSTRELDYLFGLLNKKSDAGRVGDYAGTRYVNGELFAEVSSPMLTRGELEHLKKAVEFDWRKVNPTIFGSLLEGVLGRERRSALGAHYTHEADIMKIVTPTIVRPWRERIVTVATVTDARDLLGELCAFTVLDPACGCGNFLYVAYRELRALEYELKAKITTLAETTGVSKPTGPLPYVPLTNMYGIDIERVAVMIARITLWMGHRQVMDLYGEAEAPLPLVACQACAKPTPCAPSGPRWTRSLATRRSWGRSCFARAWAARTWTGSPRSSAWALRTCACIGSAGRTTRSSRDTVPVSWEPTRSPRTGLALRRWNTSLPTAA